MRQKRGGERAGERRAPQGTMAHGDSKTAVAGTPGAYSGTGGHGAQLLRRMVEHLQERMACRETQLEARADDMRDPVTKRVEMALIRYNPKITEMEVRRRPNWRPRRSGGETGMEDREGDELRDRLMERSRKRIRQI